MSVVLPDKQRTDGVALKLCQLIKTDLPILLLSRVDELTGELTSKKWADLNKEIYSLQGSKYIIFDVIENGWNWDRKETLVVGGGNLHKFDFLHNDGWIFLDQFIRNNPPVLYLKRELLAKDLTEMILPCEYPNWQQPYPIQTKDEFNKRPISVFNYWGRSHEARLMFHGEIWKNAARKGYAVCDNIVMLNQFMQEETNQNKWISFWMPHYARTDIANILAINGQSKLSVSLPGAGVKCFRSTGESIVNSVMVMPKDDLAYSYPLVHGENCIQFPIESVDGISKEWKICEAIEEALKRDDLYDIYLGSLRAAEFYRVDNYVSYIENLINKA